MESYQVQSRIVRTITFRSSDGRLSIQFRNGEERQFKDVPQDLVEEFVRAPSPGHYYLNHIRDRFVRVAA